MIQCLTWPFVVAGRILGCLARITLRFVGLFLGLCFMILGLALTMTVAGAFIGIPFAVLGLLLMLRSVF
jgi:hypothetical protein